MMFNVMAAYHDMLTILFFMSPYIGEMNTVHHNVALFTKRLRHDCRFFLYCTLKLSPELSLSVNTSDVKLFENI